MVLSILLRKKLRARFTDSIILDAYMLGIIIYSYYVNELLAYGLSFINLFLKLKSVYKREGFEDSETDEDSEKSTTETSDDDDESNDDESEETTTRSPDDDDESNDTESEETTTRSPGDDEDTSDSSNELKNELNILVLNIEEDLGKLKEKVENMS